MPRYRLHAKVVGTKYLGEVEAKSEQSAIQKGYQLDAAAIQLCYRCTRECENGEVVEISAERIEEEEK